MGLQENARELDRLEGVWREAWPTALEIWSRFTRLPQPLLCRTKAQRIAEGLTGSFAMIRLIDHAVVIGLDLALDAGVQEFAVEILAHEIGHHVYAPADLVDNARLIARIRRGLPTREGYAGMVANLYTDLLINDRLQRSAGLNLAGVYEVLRDDTTGGPMWAMYMKSYEVLWSLPADTLIAPERVTAEIASDATLCARLIRVYGRRWLDGAGRFAALLLPYVLEMDETSAGVAPWMDAIDAGVGGMPDGLAELDDGELEDPIHPADDPELSGLRDGYSDAEHPNRNATGRELEGGLKNRYRTPTEYIELMAGIGVTVDEKDLVNRYYRERAVPHIVPFPVRESREASDPLPEGLEVWDLGAPLSAIDWTESVVRSPLIVPGVTTMERVYGQTEGAQPERTPVDLYLGVDCSGSMGNPARKTSFPVIAGAVIVLSALRAGARVMVELSGEPGEYSQTDGFVRSEREAMTILTGYLGTGYAYGIKRLDESILQPRETFRRPIHLLVVTDSDIFHMLAETEGGWEILAESVEAAGGGATLVLDRMDENYYADQLLRVQAAGWDIHHVSEQKHLVAFARQFARRHYDLRQSQ